MPLNPELAELETLAGAERVAAVVRKHFPNVSLTIVVRGTKSFVVRADGHVADGCAYPLQLYATGATHMLEEMVGD